VAVGQDVVQLFPATRVARAELAGDEVRVTNVTHVGLEGDRLRIERESDEHRTALQVGGGSLILWTARKPSPRSVEASAESVSPAAAVPATASSSSPDREDPGENDRERVSLTGRIGSAPRFRTTPNGTLVGSFSLGVHPEPGKTEWHAVVTFGSRAEKLQEGALGKGDKVAIVGYPHERQRTDGKTGVTKTITEIDATVVKKPSQIATLCT
jgi:hypothetical protein